MWPSWWKFQHNMLGNRQRQTCKDAVHCHWYSLVWVTTVWGFTYLFTDMATKCRQSDVQPTVIGIGNQSCRTLGCQWNRLTRAPIPQQKQLMVSDMVRLSIRARPDFSFHSHLRKRVTNTQTLPMTPKTQNKTTKTATAMNKNVGALSVIIYK